MPSTLDTRSYDVLTQVAGLRLIHLADDDVAFIEIPADIAFHVDDLRMLIAEAESFGWTDSPYGLLVEEAEFFGDEFDDRIVLVKQVPALVTTPILAGGIL